MLTVFSHPQDNSSFGSIPPLFVEQPYVPAQDGSGGGGKTVSIIILWHNWTFVHRNWKESHEIQTDAKKKDLAEEAGKP